MLFREFIVNLVELGFSLDPNYIDKSWVKYQKSSKDYKIEVIVRGTEPVYMYWLAWSPLDKDWAVIKYWDREIERMLTELLWYVQNQEERNGDAARSILNYGI